MDFGCPVVNLGHVCTEKEEQKWHTQYPDNIQKRGKYKVVKTIGCATTKREEELMVLLANTELERIKGNLSLFVDHDDLVVDSFVDSIANDHLQVIDPELILGKIYDKTGYPKGGCPDYFKNLVLCRLVYPGSKLKTVEYFGRHLNIKVELVLCFMI